MRGSFGGGGRGMGGGPGGGGGSMMRAIGRVAARTGVRGSGGGGLQDPFSASSTNAASNSSPTSPRKDTNKVVSKNQLSLSSSSLLGVPLSGTSWSPSHHDDDYFWVSPDESEDERGNVYLEEFLLGPVPSRDEVQNAVCAIQQVFDSATTPQFIKDRFGPNLDIDVCPPSNGMIMHHVSSKGSDLDWMETASYLSNSISLSPYGYDSERAVDAFQLLRTDSSVQKMVVSLSQDRAVWDAILNNEVVRELRESCHGGASADVAALPDETSEDMSKETNPVVDVVMQMFGHTKAKFTDMIDKITKLVNHLFNLQPSSSCTSAADTVGDLFEAKLRAAFMLTVVVLLTVVMSRPYRAS